LPARAADGSISLSLLATDLGDAPPFSPFFEDKLKKESHIFARPVFVSPPGALLRAVLEDARDDPWRFFLFLAQPPSLFFSAFSSSEEIPPFPIQLGRYYLLFYRVSLS